MTGQSLIAFLLVSVVNSLHDHDSDRFGGNDDEDDFNGRSQSLETHLRSLRHISSSSYGNARYCGVELVARIRATCKLIRQFNNGRRKRETSDEDRQLEEFLFGRDRTIRSRSAKALRILRKRGAADDCCANSCSLHHLASFC